MSIKPPPPHPEIATVACGVLPKGKDAVTGLSGKEWQHVMFASEVNLGVYFLANKCPAILHYDKSPTEAPTLRFKERLYG